MKSLTNIIISLFFFAANLASYAIVITSVWEWYLLETTGITLSYPVAIGAFFVAKLIGIRTRIKEDIDTEDVISGGFNNLLFIWITYALALITSHIV